MDATHAKPLASGAWVARQLQPARCLDKEIMKNVVIFAARPTVSLLVVASFLGCGGSTAGSSSGNLECDPAAVQDYFAGTCASGMADMLACWMPAGQCTATVDLSGYDVIFESGSILEHTYTANGQGITARYVSPSGEECGTFATVTDPSDLGWQIAYETSDGEQFELRPVGSGSDLEFVCSNGETIALSSEEQQRLQDCSGSDAVAICTQPSTIDEGDIDDIVDVIGTDCTTDSQCPSVAGVNFVCCNVYGEQFCVESVACSFL